MKDYVQIAQQFSTSFANLSEYRVLEVGSDKEGGLLNAMAPHVREIVGINIAGNPKMLAANARFEVGDIRQTRFADHSFDLVISYAVFEHVRDLPLALREIYRLLKPGGQLLTQFGPIWSCMWGHHLWIPGDVQRFVYPQPPYLPPYCHLLMTPDELRAYLGDTAPASRIDEIITFVFSSEDQNRLFHRDYVAAVEASGLTVLEMRANRNKQLEDKYLTGHGPLEQYLARLTRRYGPDNYQAASFQLHLRK